MFQRVSVKKQINRKRINGIRFTIMTTGIVKMMKIGFGAGNVSGGWIRDDAMNVRNAIHNPTAGVARMVVHGSGAFKGVRGTM